MERACFVSLNLKGGSNMMHVLSASFFGYSHISIVMQVSFFYAIHFTLWHKSLKGRFFSRKVTLFVQRIAKMAITKISSIQQISYPKNLIYNRSKEPSVWARIRESTTKWTFFCRGQTFVKKKKRHFEMHFAIP